MGLFDRLRKNRTGGKISNTICLIIAFVLSLSVVVSVFATDQVLVSNIVVEPDSVVVPVGGTKSVKATIEPKSASVKKLEWSSSDESVMTVKDGKIKGLTCGNAVATVTTTDASNTSISINVTVVQPVKKIVLSENQVSLAPGTYHVISGIVEPADATIPGLLWSSSNEKVATVDSEGKITGVGKGKAKITATASDGNGAKASISVSVNQYDLVFISKRPQEVQYYYSGSGRLVVSGSVKNGNVSIPNVNTDMWTSTSGRTLKGVEVTPVRPGTDTVTLKINGKKFNYSIFVADYFSEHDTQYVELPDTSPKASNGSFRDIVYGTPYSEIKDQLTESYGNECRIDDNGFDFRITFNHPGINVAGHDVSSLMLWFCYNLDSDGMITKDDELTSFYRAEYVFGNESNQVIADDLHTKLNELYGISNEEQNTSPEMLKMLDRKKYSWSGNDTYITLDYANSICLYYLWGPGFDKRQAISETLGYLAELEEQKKKEAEQSTFGTSTDGL